MAAIAIPIGSYVGLWGFLGAVGEALIYSLAAGAAIKTGQKIIEGSRQETGADPLPELNPLLLDFQGGGLDIGGGGGGGGSGSKCSCHGLPLLMCPNIIVG